MIRWFCDLCGQEIAAPENPVRVHAYRCFKARDDDEIGWSESDTIARVFAHERCADALIGRIKAAFTVSSAIIGRTP